MLITKSFKSKSGTLRHFHDLFFEHFILMILMFVYFGINL